MATTPGRKSLVADGLRGASAKKSAPGLASFVTDFQSILWSQLGFLLIFVLVRHLLRSGIIFYQGVALGLCICILQFVLEKRFCHLAATTAMKNALLSFLLIYAFVFTIPTTVDRSYSVMFLNRLAQSPAGLTQGEIENVYVQGFTSGGAVDKRLKEQISTGTIQEQGGRYTLTAFGRFLSGSFHLTQELFACEEKP
jgi:hypothetical protein